MPPFNLFARADPSSHDDDVGPTLIAVSAVFGSLAIVSTILRLWARKGRHILGWDDYTIALAMMLVTAEVALTLHGVRMGKGKRSKGLSKHQLEQINKYSWIAQHFLFSSMAATKTSVCLLIVRIRSSRKLKIFVGIVIAVMIMTSLELTIVLLAQCRPISAAMKLTKEGDCWPTEVRIYSIYVQSSLAVLTDLICSFLPVVIIWNVQIPLKKKCQIWALMAMGLVCTACSAMRAKSLSSKPKDIAYEYAIAGIWSISEICLGVIATNLALGRSIYYYFFKPEHVLGSSHPQSYASRTTRTGRSTRITSVQELKIDRRGSSAARSDNSDIPLKAGIHKTTEIVQHSDAKSLP